MSNPQAEVTISNTGVLSVTAGAGIAVDKATGDVTISAAVPGATPGTVAYKVYSGGNNSVSASPTLINQLSVAIPEAGLWEVKAAAFFMPQNGTDTAISLALSTSFSAVVWATGYPMRGGAYLAAANIGGTAEALGWINTTGKLTVYAFATGANTQVQGGQAPAGGWRTHIAAAKLGAPTTAPLIFSVTPKTGPAGTDITIKGQGFVAPVQVTTQLGSAPVSNLVLVDSQTITCTFGGLTPGTVNDVTVTSQGVPATLPNAFTWT